jgi:hypothetical protein
MVRKLLKWRKNSYLAHNCYKRVQDVNDLPIWDSPLLLVRECIRQLASGRERKRLMYTRKERRVSF